MREGGGGDLPNLQLPCDLALSAWRKPCAAEAKLALHKALCASRAAGSCERERKISAR